MANQNGRLVYIEPTEFAAYKLKEEYGNTENINNISWNPEDLQFTVDLQVICPDRYNKNLKVEKAIKNNSTISTSNSTSKETKINGSNAPQWISFMQGKDFGTSNYLSDAYTEISFQEVTSKGETQKEALGIDSIDITFDSHFFPLVNMKFTDVRAAALFGPTDNEYVEMQRSGILNNKDLSDEKKTELLTELKMKTSSSFFKSLFHFPYPRFMLSVMGYYGEKVTFQLAVNDFKTSFNSTNGNFDVNVSFIGYMYGLYTDLPMSLIFTAPYYNKEYWENKVEDGTFAYNGGGKMLKFIDFLDAYYRLQKDTYSDVNKKEIKIYKGLIDKKNALESILNKYEAFDRQFTYSGLLTSFKVSEHPKYFALFYENETFKLNTNYFTALEDEVNNYNTKYGSINGTQLSLGPLNTYIKSDVPFIGIIDNTISERDDIDDSEYKSLILALNILRTDIPGIKNDGKYVKKNYYIYNRGDFSEKVENELKKISDEITKKQRDIDSAMTEIIQNKLGFTPSIENIYRMIFAHIETFFEAFESKIERNINSRTAGELGLNSSNSDLPKGKTDKDTIVSPFPLCRYKNGEVEYPGSFYEANVNNIVETDFINSVINGINNFRNDAKEAFANIDSLKDKENNSFIPTSVNDVFYNGQTPYILLKEKLRNAQTDIEKAGLIEQFFFYRLLIANIGVGVSLKTAKNEVATEFENFKNSGIQISNITKTLLSDNNYHFNDSNFDKEKGKYYLDNNFFIKTPFDKDNIDNKKRDDKNLFTVLDGEYNNGVDNIKNNIKPNSSYLTIHNEEVDTLRKSIDGAYTLSYITNSGETKDKIGFSNNYDEDTFSNMYAKFNADGVDALNNYQAGILQIGEPYKDDKNKKVEYVKDLFLGDTKSKESTIKDQNNNLFNAFLFLGSICSYFKPFENVEYLYTGRMDNEHFTHYGSTMFMYPKALFLYICACAFFQDNKNNFDNVIISKDLKKVIDRYTNDGIIEETDVYSGTNMCCFKMFSSNRGIFLDNDSKLQAQMVKIPAEGLNSLKNYFSSWVNSKEFKELFNTFTNNTQASKHNITEKVNDSKKHDCDTEFFLRDSNSEQDIQIKRFLCKDLYIYKRTTKDYLQIYGINDFKPLLKEAFKDFNTIENIREEERKNEEKASTDRNELKKALYYSLKNLYDKWLSCYKVQGIQEYPFKLNTPNKDKENRKERYLSNADNSKIDSEFDSFIFVDSFFRDISDTFLVNPESFANLIKSYTEIEIMNSNKSVFEFMNEVAEKNSLLFASLPVFTNFYDAKSIENIFTPHKKYSVDNTNKFKVPGNTYVVMYTGEASSKLDLGHESEYDDDGIKDITFVGEKNVLPTELQDLFNEKTDDGVINYRIPAFGVTYGKQNQMYFKNITINMDNPKVTDYSIANLIQISYGGAHGDAESYNVGIGQDLYSIYANRSYTCTVEMLGCINIMPMMYFQLNNIPMFRGYYMIISVSHSIVPGNITTKFTGVRVSKNHIGEVKAILNYQSLLEKVDGIVYENEEGTPITCPTYEDKKIGKGYFKLSDFLKTSKSGCNIPIGELGITFDEFEKRVTEFVDSILDPLYEAYTKQYGNLSKINISSGFRSKDVNDKIKGSSTTSAHLYAYAVDLVPSPVAPADAKNVPSRGEFKAFVYYWLINNKPKFDQFIDESTWVHLGYKNKDKEQRNMLMWYRDGYNYAQFGKIDNNNLILLNGNTYAYINKKPKLMNEKWIDSHYEKYRDRFKF